MGHQHRNQTLVERELELARRYEPGPQRRKRLFSFYADADQLNRVRDISIDTGIPMAALARRGLDLAIKETEERWGK